MPLPKIQTLSVQTVASELIHVWVAVCDFRNN
jgi:hypothetical protein